MTSSITFILLRTDDGLQGLLSHANKREGQREDWKYGGKLSDILKKTGDASSRAGLSKGLLSPERVRLIHCQWFGRRRTHNTPAFLADTKGSRLQGEVAMTAATCRHWILAVVIFSRVYLATGLVRDAFAAVLKFTF